MGNLTLFRQAKDGDPTLQYTALNYRQLLSSLIPIEGILTAGALAVSPRAAGANMSVDVTAGPALIECDTLPTQNSYLAVEDSTVNVTGFPAAPSSGSRTHLVVERVRDPQADAQGSYTCAPEVVADTGSGATLPPSALPLAKVKISAGQASITAASITDIRPRAAFPGALLGQDVVPGSTATSDAYVEVAVGTDVTVTVADRAALKIAYSMVGHSEGTNKANTVQASLRRAAGTTAPGTGGTPLHSVISGLSTNQIDATLIGEYVDVVDAGTYTYGTTFTARGGTGHKDSGIAPALLYVFYAGPA
jgi:hypothetical protein